MQEKLDPMQFAYKRGRSTDDAVATLLHNVTKHLEKAGNYIRIPFIYFNSAFNTMQPHKVIEKLLQKVPAKIVPVKETDIVSC